MKFLSAFTLTLPVIVSATSIRYDTGYDDPARSLRTLACSDGINGLITRYGWQTQGQVPSFPYIGASDVISSWNSPNCGKCFRATYNGNSINFMAVDVSREGAVLSTAAMNKLTNSHSVEFGEIDVSIMQVEDSACMQH